MPALTPEQRKRQKKLQQQREESYSRAMAPRPGSKGYRSSNRGSSSKGQTIGGAPAQASPAAKPKTPSASSKPKEYFGPGGKPQPAPVKPAGVKPASQQPTITTRPAVRVTSPTPKPQPKPAAQSKPTAQSYRDAADTKGLSVGRYRTLEEHRAAVQAANALKIRSNTDTKSDVYNPSTKVDGSKLDMSKVTSKSDEYDKKKRKKL